MSDYSLYIEYRNLLGLFLKEIRVISTIRLKFVLNGVKNVISILNSHKSLIYRKY
jgi:hypothetical protein